MLQEDDWFTMVDDGGGCGGDTGCQNLVGFETGTITIYNHAELVP